MVCPNPKCKAAVAAGKQKCQRCGFPLPARKTVSLADEVTSRPWLMALLAASAFLTLWFATRRPALPRVPAAAAPVTAARAPAPSPEPEPDSSPMAVPAFAPAPAPAAPAAEAAHAAKKQTMDEPLVQSREGKWSGGPVLNPETP